MAQTMGIYIGGREEYSADFVPYGAAASGTAANSYLANQNDYMTQVLSDEILMDAVGPTWYGGFETWTGSALVPVYADWTCNRVASVGYIFATTDAKYGDYAIYSAVGSYTTTGTNDITMVNYEAVAIADYMLTFWYKLDQYTGYGRLVVKVHCYNAASALIGTLTVLDTLEEKRRYTRESILIDSLDWPALTTKIKLEFEMSGRCMERWDPYPGYHVVYDSVYLDHVRMRPASEPEALTTSFDLDDIRGFVKPFVHIMLNASESDLEFGLNGNLTDGTNDITPLENITSAQQVACYDVWRYVDSLSAFEIPNVRISDNAALTDFDQEFSLEIEGLDAGSTPMSVDDLVLLPIDNGYCAIPGVEDNVYYIIDSRSDLPGVLVSYDGTIGKAAWFSNAPLSRRFYLDPQNGSNLAILMRTQLAYHEIGEFLANVTIKYTPRFLLAP
jgi:hypothetical protein